MTDDLRASIATMREFVGRLRQVEGVPAEDRDRLAEILEEQIAEMERRQGERA